MDEEINSRFAAIENKLNCVLETVLRSTHSSEKRYWMGESCPHCNGKGRIAAKFDTYRVFEELQDQSPTLLPDRFVTAVEAINQVVEWKRGPLGSCSMYHIVAPNGEIVEYANRK